MTDDERVADLLARMDALEARLVVFEEVLAEEQAAQDD